MLRQKDTMTSCMSVVLHPLCKTTFPSPGRFHGNSGWECKKIIYFSTTVGRMSLGPTGAVSSTSDFHSGGCEFAPWLGPIVTYVEIGHEITSTADLSLSLIQEEQLSLTGKKNVY